MSLNSVRIENVRNLSAVDLDLNKNLSLITGANGAGKTSILEALHLLSTSKSFRTTRMTDVIRSGSTIMRVTAKIQDKYSVQHHLGWQYSESGKLLSLDGEKDCKVSDSATVVPVRIILPDSHYRFRQESRFRRSLLDWGVFHVEPLFQEQWQNYQKALKHRNEYLKSKNIKKPVLESWDEQLAISAEYIDRFRANYLNLWKPYITSVLERIFNENLSSISIEYDRGWASGSLKEILKAAYQSDILKGVTSVGCHRADITVKYDGKAASSYASQGQQKILYLALILAQIELFLVSEKQYGVCLMLDDVPSELDQDHRKQLLEYLLNSQIQTIITTTEQDQFKQMEGTKCTMFHVEHGEIKDMKSK